MDKVLGTNTVVRRRFIHQSLRNLLSAKVFRDPHTDDLVALGGLVPIRISSRLDLIKPEKLSVLLRGENGDGPASNDPEPSIEGVGVRVVSKGGLTVAVLALQENAKFIRNLP